MAAERIGCGDSTFHECGRCPETARCSSDERPDAGLTARLNAEADLRSSHAQSTPTGVAPTVNHTASADSVACVVAAQTASRTELLDSRAFSKFDKFRSEPTRCHDCAAVLQSYVSNTNADIAHRDDCGRGKDCSDTHCRDQPCLSDEEQVAALHAHDVGGRTCPRHLEQWTW